jgi:serine/threonine-protein kinase
MPPLHAAGDDDDWGPGEEPADHRRGGRGTWAWLAAALALILVLGGGAWWLLYSGDRSGRNDTADATPSPTVSSAAPTGLFLDPELFIGEPATEVATTLRAAGLAVTQVPADDDVLQRVEENLEAGDVAGLAPVNVQAGPGDTVTLYVAEEAYSPGQEEEEQPAPETSEAPPAPTSEAPATTAPTSTTATTTTTATTSTPTLGGEGPPAPQEPPCAPPADCNGDGEPDQPPVDPGARAADPSGTG